MSSKFVNAMSTENNWKKTENGADSLRSTTNDLLDLFGTIGALRTRTIREIESSFSKAFAQDKLLALKLSFYARNVRGGLGERNTARVIWKFLATVHPEVMKKNMHLVPLFGRWDDLYQFVGTSLEADMWKLIGWQLNEDVGHLEAGESVSLLAKWLKSTNTSSPESVKLGKLTALNLKLTERQYRKILSKLRQKINIVESKMSSNDWTAIDYQGVPSKAMNNYYGAFKKHDGDGFDKFLEQVKSGEKKINASTLFPYDIVEKIMYAGDNSGVLEEQWKALPSYVEGENNMLVMADVSGSMSGRPMATSVGLAIYFAERNRGVFHNKFMTFSSDPEFVDLKGSTLYEKVRNAMRANWNMSTDLEKAMMMILNVAVANKLSQDDLPKALIIISDMEIDACSNRNRSTMYKHMLSEFNNHGYELPKIVFWNVNSRNDTFHAVAQDGVQFASGQSASVFKSITQNADLSAYDLMLEVLNDEMYREVTI